IVIDSHLVGNPYMNYPAYLLTTVFPGILALIVLLVTTYSIGSELKHRTSHQWLKTAGKSYFTAIAGKLFPYTLLFFILNLAGILLMFHIFRFPMAGNMGFYMIGSLLFIITMQCVGVFFAGVMPVISTSISLAVLYGILAITMSGFTFPLEYMPPAIRGLSVLFPLRWFYLFTVDTTLLGLPVAQTAKYLPMIAAFILLPFFIQKRLHKALIYQNYPTN
ncbi:MAG: ABC transporter permease, partial [Bacteroidales bacterium]|nr:ABC transporter permease [Bacteroidales bacterium]